MRILIVEDDAQIADMLTEALNNRQYVVDVAQDGELGWHCVQTLDYDLVLLDVTLPKLDGIKLCRLIRDRFQLLPILMLTARDTIDDKIIGLDAGADDYMVKPFVLRELLARVRALLRRGSRGSESTLTWGDLEIDPNTYDATYDLQIISLTPKEFAILELLIAGGRRVRSRPEILEQVWSMDDPPSEEAVKAHIKTLRQKLREAGAPEDLIETVHGLGYRLKEL